ncbi:MAG: DNA repair protein RadC [Bacteroidota bacterium]
MYSPLPITQWALEDRPREKLLQRGIDSLTNAELIAILLGTGTKELSALDLGRTLLKEFGGLSEVARANVKELTRIKGIGTAKAIGLVAAFEMGRRKSIELHTFPKIRSSAEVARYFCGKLEDRTQEIFCVLFLNRNHEIKGEKILFQGGVAATVVDPKIVFKEAVNELASAIIVAHNHPSGNLKASQADIDITRKLHAGGKLLGISLLDHLIISSRGYFSFADEGLLDA